jgi:hypothetical protein
VLQIEAYIKEADGRQSIEPVKQLDLGALVRPSFMLTTEAYREWTGNPSAELLNELLKEGAVGLEQRTGR